ncbi:tRNA (adenosine(37)-N6)-threonylcarbamoyltransferase complex ATPase subunit type 1 TsaE [Candidatus Cardinium hertigii]|uniref:tRNA threonylcarbamoyladenosine biosynthesis protein TsaE n=1 Tax=Candidatus Cardinium hertigii TaxID=247481 RepID=A0A3N2QB44_9BACT|nr:tRNA (adenosine(37)-N6)-threonylcarbamoyltransferase complex ATPase subunit type 1 TsaE [Candidatus Cardinium hertigii]ROT47028.1 tRNA (adenosine(37)-N6)-threonylcarbamoyltransferase complex ATPase subunit type 1 TsaE [Candidatus Cardinium hertigii]
MILTSIEETLADTIHQLLHKAGSHRIFLLEGPIGAGKTTLIKGLCNALGVMDVVHSPTFALINEYKTIDNGCMYHFDCYRMHGISDAIALDFESYFSSGYYCFIEWPSKIEPILPEHHFLIRLEIATPNSRNLICSSY